MTEKEKMFNGKVYDPFSEGMPEERTQAHALCKAYNETNDTEGERREEILKELMPNHGENVYLQGPIYFDFGTHISMGEGSFANFNFTVLDEGKVIIGKNVFIGPNVSILTPIHSLRYQERNAFYNEKTGKVTNSERAGSVVTRDIPSNTLAVGVPCRVLRSITEKDTLQMHPEYFSE